MSSTACNVFVVCRFRPLNVREKEASASNADKNELKLDIQDAEVTVVRDSGRDSGNTFTLDKVFDPDSQQRDIYEHVARKTIADITDGFNGTIFAYGQTGSGKTFTMMGPDLAGDPDLAGIIPRSILDIFDYIAADDSETEFTIKCAFMEIYNERIHDLVEKQPGNLQVREHPSRGVYVDGLQEVPVSRPEVRARKSACMYTPARV